MRIVKYNITNQVIDFIRDNIESGNWKVGEKIPSENKLTETLGVSRTSVRVALQQFIAIGALESIHGKGTFVINNRLDVLGNNSNNITENDCKDISKVLEFRRILEPESCYLAANNASNETLNKLKKYLDAMKGNIGNPEAFVEADILFHVELCKASGNHLLEKTLNEVFNQTSKNHIQMNEIFGYQDGIYYHTRILKALEKRNAKLAKKLMHDHLQQAIERIELN